MSAKEGGWLRERANYVLLRALYLVLWLQYRARELFRRLPLFRRRATAVGNVPRHIALSGAIANSDADIAMLAELAVARGAEHITLYDPWTTVNMAKIAKRLCTGATRGRAWAVREMDENGFMGKELWVHGEVIEVSHGVEDARKRELKVQVTVVRPGAGRASLVRAVGTLAERSNGDEELSVAEVAKWLDRNAGGMLPSEPDVVVVFPPDDVEERATVLHGFPVWQLRLTQIRFATKTIRDLEHYSFLEMVTSAAAAPKRFGR